MIYKIIQVDEENAKTHLGGMSESMLESKKEHTEQSQNRTIYKNRFNKAMVRSASKNKDDSMPKSSQKESNTVSLKKKYESLMMGKGR